MIRWQPAAELLKRSFPLTYRKPGPEDIGTSKRRGERDNTLCAVVCGVLCTVCRVRCAVSSMLCSTAC